MTGEALRDVENEIFKLRRKADLELRAGNTEAFQRIQTTIANLQRDSGAVTGRGKATDNAGID
jgi:hypothetical protein